MTLRRKVDELGTEVYFLDNVIHREDGPAMIEKDGSAHWFRHGDRHREGGPAVIMANGNEYWFHNGVTHRIDGPAIIHNGEPLWFVKNNRVYSAKEFQQRSGCSDEYLTMLILKYGEIK